MKLSLCYLPFQAMAEPTRLCLRYGGIAYDDYVVWGQKFSAMRYHGSFPYDKVPVMFVKREGAAAEDEPDVIPQSGSICRFAAKLAGCYPQDPLAAAHSDHVFEMAQEMCTINPLINCYTGPQYTQIKQHYFESFDYHCENLTLQLRRGKGAEGAFFGGADPTFADFNVFHMLSNATLAKPDCLDADAQAELREWMAAVAAVPGVKEYLAERPTLEGIGTDPALVDRNGCRVSQRRPEGGCMRVDECFSFESAAPPPPSAM